MHEQRMLNRALGHLFYRQHTGMFLMLFFILVGIPANSGEVLQLHTNLMRSMHTDWLFFAFGAGLWLLYILKTIIFNTQQLAKPSFGYLSELLLLPPARRWRRLFRLQLFISQPVLGYVLIAVILGLREGYWATALAMVAVNAGLCAGAAGCLMVALNPFSKWQRRFRFTWPFGSSGFAGIMLRQLFTAEKWIWLVMKSISLTLLYQYFSLNASVFDPRVGWMLYLVIMLGHIILVYRLHLFEESSLYFYRNLPARRIHIYLSLLLLYAVAMLPEMIVAATVMYKNMGIYNAAMLAAGAPLLLLLQHSLCYTDDMDMGALMQLLFGVGIVFFFALLSGNYLLLPLGCLLASGIIVAVSYYGYEKKSRTTGLE